MNAPFPATQVLLSVEGMSCAACAGRVERALAAVPGVTAAEVNLITATARVTGAAASDLLAQAATQAGYPAQVAPDPLAAAAAAEAYAVTDRRHLTRDTLLAAGLTLPVVLLAMGGHVVPALHHMIAATLGTAGSGWVQMILTALVLALPGRRFLADGIPALARLSPDMNSLVALGAGSAFLYSVLATLAPGLFPAGAAEVYFEAAALVVTLILAGRWLESRAKRAAAQAIRRLLDLQPATARIRRDGTITEVAVEDLAPGDIIDLTPGERLPADGILVEGQGAIDESLLTGEARPALKIPGDRVTGGTVNGSAALAFRVTAAGPASHLARIARMVQAAQAGKPPVAALADRIIRRFVPAVLGLAVLTLALWLAFGTLPEALTHAVAVLVIACPCAMGLATPVSVLAGTGRGGQLGILYRDGAALQRLAEVRGMAFDKTGTLTLGHPALTDAVAAEGFTVGEMLAAAAAVEARSEHPLAAAVVRGAQARGLAFVPADKVTARVGHGITGTVAGRRVDVGHARFISGCGADPAPLQSQGESLATQGRSAFFVAIDGRLAGLIAVADPIRPDAAATLRALTGMGVETAMVSGDAEATAQAVARGIGIGKVQAGVAPEGKPAALLTLPRPVAFVGDGINDAPALAAADVGIAMGGGADIAVETADVVLTGAHLGSVVTAVALARATLRNIRQNLFWAFAYNAALIPVAAGALTAQGITLSPALAAAAMAASSLFVLGNALRLRRFRPPPLTAALPSGTPAAT